MNRTLLLLIFCAVIAFAKTQEVHEEEVFTIVEKMPVYGKCEEQQSDERFTNYHKELSKCSTRNLLAYLESEISKIRSNYAPGYHNSRIQFIVEKDGSLSNVVVKISSGNLDIDTASLDIIKNMQEWEAGTQRGVLVRVSYLLTLTFK